MDGLQAVSDIWKSSSDDDTHGVIDVTLFHLFRDVSSF